MLSLLSDNVLFNFLMAKLLARFHLKSVNLKKSNSYFAINVYVFVVHLPVRLLYNNHLPHLFIKYLIVICLLIFYYFSILFLFYFFIFQFQPFCEILNGVQVIEMLEWEAAIMEERGLVRKFSGFYHQSSPEAQTTCITLFVLSFLKKRDQWSQIFIFHSIFTLRHMFLWCHVNSRFVKS